MATLRDILDYQKFADNARMGSLIKDTESRYGITGDDSEDETASQEVDSSFRRSLSISELNYINAAGIPDIWQANAAPDPDKKDRPWNRP